MSHPTVTPQSHYLSLKINTIKITVLRQNHYLYPQTRAGKSTCNLVCKNFKRIYRTDSINKMNSSNLSVHKFFTWIVNFHRNWIVTFQEHIQKFRKSYWKRAASKIGTFGRKFETFQHSLQRRKLWGRMILRLPSVPVEGVTLGHLHAFTLSTIPRR